MAKLANINPTDVNPAAGQKVVKIQSTTGVYANDLNEAYQGAETKSNDHFVSTMSDIDSLADYYQVHMRDDNVFTEIEKEVHNNTNLSRWMIAVMCAFVYGFDNENELHVKNLPFNRKDTTRGMFVPARQRKIDGTKKFELLNAVGNADDPSAKFLECFRKKFNGTGGSNHNAYNFNPTELPGTLTVDEVNENGLNVLSFFGDTYEYQYTLGTYSSEYFVIPMREINLYPDEREEKPAWQKRFLQFCERERTILAELNDLLTVREKVLLRLSAASIGAGGVYSSKSMLLIKGIIEHYVDIGNITLAPVPSIKEINNIKFYKILDNVDLSSLLLENLYLGCQGDKYYALYPFSQNFVAGLKEKACSITGISLSVTPDPNRKRSVKEVKIKLEYTSKFVFAFPEDADEPVASTIDVPGQQERTYSSTDVRYMESLNTFCMYPNIPLEYEGQCEKYTYFSYQKHPIMLGEISLNGSKLKKEDMKDAEFFGGDGQGNSYKILDYATVLNVTSFSDTNVDDSGKTPLQRFESGETAFEDIDVLDGGRLYMQERKIPEHFIKVCEKNTSGTKVYGFILNVAGKPALLIGGAAEPTVIDLSVTPQSLNNGSELSAYVDFGSSSSCIKYKDANAGDLSDEWLKPESCIRMLLAEYAKEKYKHVVNLPENSHVKFPSAAAFYTRDRKIFGLDRNLIYYPYRSAYMPITKKLTEYMRELCVSPSDKTTVAESNLDMVSRNVRVILYHMCYLMACTAVAQGSGKLRIIPSIPSKNYSENMLDLWNRAAKKMKEVFPSLDIKNVLNTEYIHCLYESIAISNGTGNPRNNGTGNPRNNSLQISIDMGDSTTDMSAIIVDEHGEKHVCGYSSVEYAGKNLIKQTVYDIMSNVSSYGSAECVLKGSESYGSELFTPLNNESSDNLLDAFFVARKGERKGEKEDGERKGEKEDDDRPRRNPVASSWENDVVDLLSDNATINKGIDTKIAANFILRYMFLMPVIKDFISTSIKIANCPYYVLNDDGTYRMDDSGRVTAQKERFISKHDGNNNTMIEITFYGGSSKGIDLFSTLDSRARNVYKLMEKYFRDAFSDHSVTVGVSPEDGKDILLKGLYRLVINPQHNGMFKIKVNGIGNEISWEETVDPSKAATVNFGNPVSAHLDLEKPDNTPLFIPAKTISDDGREIDQTPVAEEENKAAITSHPENYYDVRKAYEELKKHFNDIYNALINNHDSVSDPIEVLCADFINSAGDTMKTTIRDELNGGESYQKATINSDVYPEMIKSTCFMFALSKLLTKYHGEISKSKLKADGPGARGRAEEYRFGK